MQLGTYTMLIPQGKGTMTTWWLLGQNGKYRSSRSVSLDPNRLVVTSPPQGKSRGLPKRAVSEIIKDGQRKDGVQAKKLSLESAIDSSRLGQMVTLPGSIL